MNTKEVKKMEPMDRFLYWCRERHRVYERKEKGMRKPWTDDEILQSYFFTNPYRENDKVTKWFRENIREPLAEKPDVLFATVAFRWFNLPKTVEVLNGMTTRGMYRHGLLQEWHEARAVRAIQKLWKEGPVFSGAYMIKAGNGPKGCKIPSVCAAISNVWEERKELVALCRESRSLEVVTKRLAKFPHLGPFMSYEIVTDLRHTFLLRDAHDIMTWANPGPGAMRGLNRMSGRTLRGGKQGADTLNEMRALLAVCNRKLPQSMPRFEMREVEHSLCEWDKYERLLQQDGMKAKRRYDGAK